MILVLSEFDYQDKERLVIGVASCRKSALIMIRDYYGKDAFLDDIKDIRDSNIDFSIGIKVDGCRYIVTAMDFSIDEI
jgi:hypothetical protein